ncbi:RNase P subunit p30-domain-containing protein [Limtongia smithiae]|uniref:RNase P subunit p30-domain-containing protein n=1 Tax=Limtongia smithiae TaxID=1125753 RepID=UPI0034CEFE23
MFYDLCIPWPPGLTASSTSEYARTTGAIADLYKTVAMLYNLGYRVFAYEDEIWQNTSRTSAIFADVFRGSLPGATFLSRATVVLSDAAQVQSLPSLAARYDILAVRPTDEKLLVAACTNMDVDIIALDLTQRLPYMPRHRLFGAAVARGIKFEICYSSATKPQDNNVRRHLIANAASLFRATRGKGIVISSGARSALECRGPYDITNLTTLWGFTQEQGKRAIDEDARAVVVHSRMRARTHRQAIEVLAAGSRGAGQEVQSNIRPVSCSTGGLQSAVEEKSAEKGKNKSKKRKARDS